MTAFQKFDRENVVDELKDRDQWLLWDASAERKQPFTLAHGTLSPASWNDPDDWLSFQKAADFAEQRDPVGLGYVFAKTSDEYARGVYGGLDLDGCFVDGSPKEWLPDLQPFVERDAYVEFSPSAANPEKESHGAHIPLAGFEPPEWWSDVEFDGAHEGVEAYGSKFFTFTGDRARSSGDRIADTGDYVEEWLADAYEAVTGETAPPRREDGQDNLSDYERAQRDHEPSGNDGTVDDEWLDQELVEEALGHISANCSYNEWRNIGFALADFFDRESTALSVFTDWSRASAAWDDDAPQLAKKIIDGADDAGVGDVTIATVVHKAVNGGWEPPSSARAPSMKELAAKYSDQFDSVEEVPDDFLEHVPTDSQDGEGSEARAEAVAGGPDPNAPMAETDGGGTTTAAAAAAMDSDDLAHEDRVAREIFRDVLVPLRNPDNFEGEPIGKQRAAHRTAELLNEHYHWVRPRSDTRGWRDTLYNYVREEGIYEPHGEPEAERLVERYCQDAATNDFVNQVVGKLERMNRVRARRLDEGPERLVVANGILDLTTGELEEHTPGEFHKTRLDWEWNPDAEVDAVDEFLHEVVDGKDVNRLYRFIAHSIYKEYPGEKAAMLLGEGRNGKSMFLEVVEEFLGEFNTAHQPLRDLNEDRWAAAYLNGKLANVVPDMSDQTPDSMQQFKALTGGDTVSGDVKFENPVRFTNHATLMFACNSMPVLHDDTRGNWRRWQLITFPHTFDNTTPDAKDAEPKESLRERLYRSEEFQGLLVRCVEEIQRWAQDPEEPFFPDADGWKVTRAKMRKAAEPVYDFAHTCLRPNEDSELPKEEVRECYRRYATEEGLSKFGEEEFGRRLLNLTDFNIESARLRGDDGPNHRVNVYKGVEFTDRAKSILRDETPSSAAQRTTDDFTAPDGSTKGSRAATERVLEIIKDEDPDGVPRGRLAELLTRHYGLNLDEADDEITTALHNGVIMDCGDGLRPT